MLQEVYPDARDAVSRAKTTRCKNEQLFPLIQKTPLLQYVSPDARDAVSRVKTTRCKNELIHLACQARQGVLFPDLIAR